MGNERKQATHIVFSHLPTSEALNRGLVFTLILCRVHLSSRVEGQEASLSCK